MRTNQPLIEEDVPRYRKKVKPHSPAKSKHKHDYQKCLFEYNVPTYVNMNGFSVQKDMVHTAIGTYCSICGKVGDINWMSMLNPEKVPDDDKRELNPETRTVPVFWLDDIYKQKFVTLD